ncbi:MAG: family 1 glycosylhydrolase, partial [Bacillota bacterium]
MPFPQGFVWGVSSSAYQTEGAFDEDGKGSSVWDEFCRIPGVIQGGQDGRVACDAYHRYPEDVRLMKQMGLAAYRFSVSWPRVLPDGTGCVNEKGLA